MALVDQHNRPINYLRLAVTDRCNLRCSYCMPEQGINFLHKTALLSYEEMLRIINILAGEGLNKVRITGGEPFVRQGLMDFLEALLAIKAIQKVAITSNGVLMEPHLTDLKRLGINDINLSLDTLDKQRFFNITRRDEFDKVVACLEKMIELGMRVKVNAVVMKDQNDADILSLVDFAKTRPISIRFIEEMPFNGNEGKQDLYWSFPRILEEIKSKYPNIQKVADGPNSTSYNYQIPGHKGQVGIIAAYTRSFCGTCNRIRLTPQGELKTCLYQQKGFQLRDLIRSEADDKVVKNILTQFITKRYKDGFEAEAAGNKFAESMSSIGG